MKIQTLRDKRKQIETPARPARIEYIAENYQSYTTKYIVDNLFCGVFLEMGLGKTVSTLTAIDLLFHKYFDVSKVLVIAPKLVAQDTWSDEIDKWAHLNRLTYSKILGTPKQRVKALKADAHIYLINYDNLAWLVAELGGWWPFDMVVADESSRLKSHKSKRHEALKAVEPFIERFVLLTGTPMANGYIDLWAQIYHLDKGFRLGKNITTYRKRWFIQNHDGFSYVLRDQKCAKQITRAIADICVSMRQKDYLSLPERIERRITLSMPPELKDQYKRFERERVMEFLEKEEKITAINAAVLTGKLLQFANGAVYDEDRNVHEVHMLKIEALAEILESSTGHSVLVAYQFQHDLERIMKHLKRYKPELAGKAKDFLARWNAGEIPFAVGHPKSIGHGLNMQAGGHIIVNFGHTWSPEERAQFIARLERKGQTQTVIVHDLVVKGTLDERVLRRQAEKKSEEEFVMDSVKAIIREHGGSKAERFLESKPKKIYFFD